MTKQEIILKYFELASRCYIAIRKGVITQQEHDDRLRELAIQLENELNNI